MSPAPEILSVSAAAELLSVHPETVRRLARQRTLPAFKVGRHWRFRRAELVAWAHGGLPDRERSPSILIVDDELGVLQLVSRLVERLGFRGRTALDGAEGLVEVAREVPDLVLLDLVMPVVDGPEFLRRVRPEHPELPVIIITGHPDSDLMTRAAAFGLVMLLRKPLVPVQLEQALCMILPQPGQERVVPCPI